MNQAEIETFLMIVKTKNITKTAENLFLSQPTVSHRLKLLEAELNVKLLARKKGYKQVELTSQGESFVSIAERWLSVCEEMKMLQHDHEKLYLSVGCTDTLNTAILFDLYRNILNDNELHMSMKIKTHYSTEIYDLLEKHEIDLGFVYHHLHFKNIIAEPLLREKMYIVQSNDTKLRTPMLHTDELNIDDEIFISWEENYRIWHDQWVSKGQRPRIEVDTFELLLHLISDNSRWFIAPISVVDRVRGLREVYVSEIANRTQPPERITYKIKNKYPNEATLKAVQLFEDKMMNYLENKDWGLIK